MSTTARRWRKAAQEVRPNGTVPHVQQEGARHHVLYWTGRDGMRCSEPRCEINHRKHDEHD